MNELAPTIVPATSHGQPSARRTARIAHSSTAGHTTRSRLAVTSRCPNARVRVAPAMIQAVSDCAARPPPTSRVTRARSGSEATAHSSGTIRSADGVSPNSATDRSASSGVSGGWSVYPQAGGSIRK